MKVRNIFLLGVGVAILIGSLVLTGVLYFKLEEFNREKVIAPEDVVVENESEITSGEESGQPKIPTENREINWIGETEELSESKVVELINKISPNYEKILEEFPTLLKECKKDTERGCNLNENFSIKMYLVGHTKDNNFPVYIMDVPTMCFFEMGPGFARDLAIYDTVENKLTKLVSTPEQFVYNSNVQYGKIETDCLTDYELKTPPLDLYSKIVRSSFSELEAPKKIDWVDNKNSVLTLVGPRYSGFKSWNNIGENGDFGLIDNTEDANNFLQKKLAFSDPKTGQDVYFNGECYFIKNKVGSVFVYSIQPYFLTPLTPKEAEKNFYPNTFNLDVVWENGIVENEKFLNGKIASGCGVSLSSCNGVIKDISLFFEGNLIPVAKTKLGDILFDLKEKSGSLIYWQTFRETTSVGGVWDIETPTKENLTEIGAWDKYNEFLNDRPFLFWKDGFGNWRFLQKSKYVPLAECGKPVIYLYPEKEMNVKVEVKPNGGFSKTEPMYDNGWLVRATPQSDLFNYTDRQNYPYLFWEGKAYDYATPDYGFVMSKNEVGTKMTQILAKLGLNEKEIKDFLEFWQPKLEVSPYVFVTFLPQKEFDKLAPLTVNPRPTTVIRVFMDYTPLEKPVEVAPMYIKTPVRNGFTVVEWGGRLR